MPAAFKNGSVLAAEIIDPNDVASRRFGHSLQSSKEQSWIRSDGLNHRVEIHGR